MTSHQSLQCLVDIIIKKGTRSGRSVVDKLIALKTRGHRFDSRLHQSVR